jgi:hypothetical protein
MVTGGVNMSDEKYTPEDWMDLNDAINYVEEESEMWNIDKMTLERLKKASDFIKEKLGIKTEPIVIKSIITNEWYYTNIYREVKDIIVAISKRPATEDEIKEALEKMNNG